MATENLTTYIEVDSESNITVTTSAAQFENLTVGAISYVYKDYGPGYFGNFSIDFNFEIFFMSNEGQTVLCSFSNSPSATMVEQIAADDGIMVTAWRSGNRMRMQLYDWNTDNSDVHLYALSSATIPPTYCTFERSGTNATLYMYSDPTRTTLIDTLTFSFVPPVYSILVT